MGSGKGGGYGSGGSGSQPYAPTYHVTSDMMARDKADTDIYNPSTGYFKNPTATNIETSIKGRIEAINNDSGHYKPNSKSLDKVYTALSNLYEKNPNVVRQKMEMEKLINE